MSREAALGWVLGAIAVVLLAGVVFTFLRGTTTETIFHDAEPDPTAEGVVAGLTEESGRSFLGRSFGSSTYHVRLSFLADGACEPHLAGAERWPADAPDCPNPLDVAGELVGRGTDHTGAAIVGVRFEVSEECYEALSVGDSWTTVPQTCHDDARATLEGAP